MRFELLAHLMVSIERYIMVVIEEIPMARMLVKR